MQRQITVRLCSGLGNQLFQVTCGLACARRRGAELSCDTTWYGLVSRLHRPARRFRLHHFSLPINEAFTGWQRWTVGFAAAAYDRWKRGKGFLEATGRMKVIQEQEALRPQAPENAENFERLYLNGYWQTAEHFLSVRDVLRPMLSVRKELSAGAQHWMHVLQGRKTGFIHIRRGDYTSLVGDSGLLPVDYYRRAVRAMEDATGGGIHWLVFAEYETWARQHMAFLPEWQLVDYDSPDRDIEDLQLMAACNAAIIANSSYSWWGSALGDQPGRPVIAPDRYWNKPGASTDAWVLPSWLSVQAWD
jgi:hypothetical protein